jgi:aspartyl-tRNA(Asn)/glutamyl-tRNA(Gln) amidotransferase subunit B
VSAWEPVIGLEVHVELDTETKMFCGCAVGKGEPPNTRTCPVCLAHPGALPVLNERAVEYATRIALALNCTVRPRNVFHRKNYFYPDLPKAYQISQFDEPLAVNGVFDYWVGDEKLSCRIHRVHMEEDAAKLVHAGGESGRIAGSEYSVVDFNRGGTPLVEIVGEPDIPSPAAAREFLMQLRNLVIELGVSECNMEEGQVRWDANLSLRPAGATELGTRTELKNMNSFRFLQQALEAEMPRQIAILEAGGTIDQETLHFDPDTGTTTPLRSKEEAHDYRYFPEPDLVPWEVAPAWVEEVRAALPELPAARVERVVAHDGL